MLFNFENKYFIGLLYQSCMTNCLNKKVRKLSIVNRQSPIVYYPLLILCLCLFAFSDAFAQQDTTTTPLLDSTPIIPYDTVYISTDTVRVVDTLVVYIEDPIPYRISVEMGGGASYMLSSVQGDGNSERQSRYITPLASYTAGGRLNISIDNYTFSGGVQYSQFNEQFKYTQHTLHFDTVSYTETVIIRTYTRIENGDTVRYYLLREDWKTRIDTTHITTEYENNNLYEYIEIPILAGYEKHSGKMYYSVKAGLVFGFFLQAKSMGLVPASDGYTVANRNKTDFKPRVNDFIVAGSIYRSLNKRFCTGIELYYRNGLNQVLDKEQTVKMRFQSAGIKIGFQYFF